MNGEADDEAEELHPASFISAVADPLAFSILKLSDESVGALVVLQTDGTAVIARLPDSGTVGEAIGLEPVALAGAEDRSTSAEAVVALEFVRLSEGELAAAVDLDPLSVLGFFDARYEVPFGASLQEQWGIVDAYETPAEAVGAKAKTKAPGKAKQSRPSKAKAQQLTERIEALLESQARATEQMQERLAALEGLRSPQGGGLLGAHVAAGVSGSLGESPWDQARRIAGAAPRGVGTLGVPLWSPAPAAGMVFPLRSPPPPPPPQQHFAHRRLGWSSRLMEGG